MATTRLILDNGAVGPVDFTRNNAARGPDGAAYAADAPRWDDERVVFGAPTVETVDADSSVYTLKSAGVGASNSSIVVYRKFSAQAMIVRNAATLGVISTTLTRGASAFTKPSTLDDMLRGQADEEEDHCFNPRGHCCVYNGLIYIQCDVASYNGSGDRSVAGNWSTRRVGAVYSLDNGATWKKCYRGPIEGAAGSRCNEWSGGCFTMERSGFAVGSGVPHLVTADADYRNDVKDGASAYLVKWTLSGGVWTPSPAHRQTYADPGGNNTHLHILTVFRDPANPNGLKKIWSIGDGRAYSITLETRVSDFDWDDATSVADSSNVVENATAFTSPTAIGGTATGTSATSRYADQPISVAPAFAVNEYAVGTDEGLSAILRGVAPSANGDPFELRASFTLSMLSQDAGNQRVFQLHAQDCGAVNPAVVGLLTPGGTARDAGLGGFADAGTRMPRVVCKPAGESAWGVVFAFTGEAASDSQRRPVIDPLGYVWLSTGESVGLRRFALPPYRVARGAFAGPGGTNYARSDWSQIAAPGTGNTVTTPYSLPGQAAPSAAVVAEFLSAGTNINMGRHRLTHQSVPRTHTNLWLVQSLGPVLYDGSASTLTHAQMHRQRLNSAEDGTGGQNTPYRGSKRVEAQGAYTILWQRYVSGGVDWTTASISVDPFTLAVQPQFGDGSAHAGHAAVQYPMVLVDPDTPPSYMLPVAASGTASGDDETLFMPCATGVNWTALASLVLYGRDPWWHDVTTYRPVLTLWQDADNYVAVEHNGQRGIRVRWRVAGSDEATKSLTLDGYILRGDPLHVGVSCQDGDYVVRLSVGGSAVLAVTDTAGTTIRPVRVYVGSNGSAYEAAIGHAIRVNGSAAEDGDGLTAAIRTLGAWQYPAGGIRSSRLRNRDITVRAT